VLKLYIAAPIQLRPIAQQLMTELQAAGYRVTARWLRVDDMPDTEAAARMDLEDIDEAEALVLLNFDEWRNGGTGGRHAEFGYAIAKGKTLFLVGVCTNVFHYLTDVHVVPHLAQLLPRLDAHRLLAESRL